LGAIHIDDLKSHAFFYGVEWSQLMKQEVEGPLKSIIQSEVFMNHAKHSMDKIIDSSFPNKDLNLPNIEGLTYNPDII